MDCSRTPAIADACNRSPDAAERSSVLWLFGLDCSPSAFDHSCDFASRPAAQVCSLTRMRSRTPFLALALVLSIGVPGCRGPRAAHPLKVANPDATFEVELSGCNTTGVSGRRFGPNVRTALLWSHERVHTATYLPCTATIAAVRGNERHAVYRVSRTRDGAYVEQLLHRQP